ncbi:hypothetical protein Tco_0192628, partial [Tanacetum coccineum]
AADDQKQVEDGPDNENDEKDKYKDDSSPKEVNTAGQHVNTASPKVNIGHPEGYDLFLWGDLKTMIEPNEEDEIWRDQQD